jgi:hypothetical protein
VGAKVANPKTNPTINPKSMGLNAYYISDTTAYTTIGRESRPLRQNEKTPIFQADQSLENFGVFVF